MSWPLGDAPWLQATRAQVPALQSAWALSKLQGWLHAPQLEVVVSDASQPSLATPLQSPKSGPKHRKQGEAGEHTNKKSMCHALKAPGWPLSSQLALEQPLVPACLVWLLAKVQHAPTQLSTHLCWCRLPRHRRPDRTWAWHWPAGRVCCSRHSGRHRSMYRLCSRCHRSWPSLLGQGAMWHGRGPD